MDTVVLEPAPPPPPAQPAVARRRSRSWIGWVVAVLLAGVGVGGWYWEAKAKSKRPPASTEQPADPQQPAATTGQPVGVDVTRPKPGGIERVCVQPGTVEPFEAADLYAKISGYLQVQSVDIGSRVRAGDVLARLSVPEAEQAVVRDKARVQNAAAQVRQAEARLVAAEADARAAEATVSLARVTVRAKSSFRKYREEQLDRIKKLVESRSLDAKLQDEQEDFYQSAVEAENAAREGVNASQERAAAAKANVSKARADIDQARAEAGVVQADLARSEVLLGYTVITSPYTGVVTRRSFHPGDFVKAADQGGLTPLLTVERTDVVRVVVQVPDRDVPFVDVGDAASLEIDALPGRPLRGKVARFADSEDPATRLMRTEVDLPNPDGKLRRGMYGRATLVLSAGAATAVRVPSAAVVHRKDGGRAEVRVVRDGAARVVPVTVGDDNGTETEVLTGLAPTDTVIVRAAGPLADGTPVAASGPTSAGH